jgi:hypothetical protein
MVSMNDLFAKMTTQELETYANTGVTPAWFKTTVGATQEESQEMENDDE